MLDVIQVILQTDEHVLRRGSVALPDESPPPHARFHDMPEPIQRKLGCELLDEFRTLGPRPDRAHVSLQHVEELRKLVDMSGSKKPPNASHSRIGLLRPYGAVALGVHDHRSEFVGTEHASADTHALLHVENWPR